MECKCLSTGAIVITDVRIGERSIILDKIDQKELIKFIKGYKPVLFIDAITEE